MAELKMQDCTTVELTVDQVAKIFFFDNRVYRAVNEEYIDQVNHMFSCGLIEEIVSKKLFPKTWVSDTKIEGYSLVIEHEKIIHWNYPYEWSFDMLRDAGLLVLEINKIANKYGYQIMDGHAYNVVFNMNKPQYIDFGSFNKIDECTDESWMGYKIFHNHFYVPLFLWSRGYSDVARNTFLMRDYFNENEFLKIKHPLINLLNINLFNIVGKVRTVSLASKLKIRNRIKNPIKKRVGILLKWLFKGKFTSLKLEKRIRGLVKPVETSMWNNYHDNIETQKNKRFIRIKEIINDLHDAKSLVELASNQGKFAQFVLNETHIETVIATDYDKEAVNIMYLNNNNDNFSALLFDMVRTNGRGVDESINQRIKSDIVVALAVTHHLILTQNITIDYIFNAMKKLTNKYIVIEFMPIGLYGGDLNNIPSLPEFYNLSWFRNCFIKYFDLILDEELEVNRHVFIGKVKKDVTK